MKAAATKIVEEYDFKGDARWELTQRVVSSSAFRNSARLRDFLLYVTACAIREAPEEATEQQIGIYVFQRHPGFNTTEDSIVRSQARLLRNKLAVYFQTDGLSEPTLIQIPKGHYLPVFQDNVEGVLQAIPDLIETIEPIAKIEGLNGEMAVPLSEDRVHPLPLAETHPARSIKLRSVLAFLLLIALSVTAFFLGRRSQRPASLPKPISRLWSQFLTGDPPQVIYSNAAFVGNSMTGMRNASADPAGATLEQGPVVDHYTGIGELAAVRAISQIFDQQHAEFVLKRSRLVTWDEAKLHNLIFIGSIAENASLKVLPQSDDFTMVTHPPEEAGFLNHHPKAGEPAQYMRQERPLTKDYALIALRPGVDPNLKSFIFSGLTTLGTEAAVEYATTPQTADQLLRLVSGPNQQIHPFEALLEVDINDGVALSSKIITIRIH